MKTNQNNLLIRIFQILLKYNKGETSTDYEYHRAILENFVSSNSKIKMLIPAFPGKSINSKSVFNENPDYGEKLALGTLSDMAKEIEEIYPYGCEISVFHDGHYFYNTDCMRSYKELDNYINLLKKSFADSNIKHLTIDDIFMGNNYDEMVNAFIIQYCPDIYSLKNNIVKDNYLKQKYVNEYIFVKNEFADELFKDVSSSMQKRKSKELALKIIAIEYGMGKLFKEKYENYLRLSIHVQNDSKSHKFYINLLPTSKNLGTPWFNVVVKDMDGGCKFMKKYLAEKSGFKYILNNGLPYYLSENKLT